MKTMSFVIPVFNEEKRIGRTIEALKTLEVPGTIVLEKVIFVNDGSKDSTEAKILSTKNQLKKHLKAKIEIISYSRNRGKGAAIRRGMKASNSDYTLFFDADMSTPLSEIIKFIPQMEWGVQTIIGTRKNGKSTVITHQPYIREFMGKCFTRLTNTLLQTNATDLTCGFKAFSKTSKEEIFGRTVINRWGYDAELIFLIRKLGYSSVEVPVIWSNQQGSKVKIYQAVPQSLWDILKIRWTHDLQDKTNPLVLTQPKTLETVEVKSSL